MTIEWSTSVGALRARKHLRANKQANIRNHPGYNAKLAKCRQMQESHDSGLSYGKIAAEYGISNTRVMQLLAWLDKFGPPTNRLL